MYNFIILNNNSRFPLNHYSKKEIVTAGKILKEKIPADDKPSGRLAELLNKNQIEILDAFKIAHHWRDAHIQPLMLVRQQLATKCRHLGQGTVSAARLKRMHSIRGKLQKRPLTLYQMQDIAGCRAILNNQNEINELVNFYGETVSRHVIHNEDNYIQLPKKDGYRSHHIVLKFQGKYDNQTYKRQTVEVQLRTKLQHSWATAVEAVGLLNKQNIKGGDGSKPWRRFFELMSSEIAYEENQPLCPSAKMDRKILREELRSISSQIEAVKTLESINQSMKHFEQRGSSGARYFLLQFDYSTQNVIVEPFIEYNLGSQRYMDAERNQPEKNSVLVEVSQIIDLQTAFPNYFLNVQSFTNNLKKAISPKTTSKNPVVKKKAEFKWNLSWLKNWKKTK